MYSTSAKSVAVVPSCGLIYPGNHQILTLVSTFREDSPRQDFNIHLQLNASENALVLYNEYKEQR